TWASVAQTLYGTADVAPDLQAAIGNPSLVAGSRLNNPPATLAHTTWTTYTVLPYYAVRAGDTWAGITQLLYGTSDPNAIGVWQISTGTPPLTAGADIYVPSVLNYQVPHTGSAQTDITDALGNVTTYKMDAGGRLTEVDAPAINGVRAATTYSYTASNELA